MRLAYWQRISALIFLAAFIVQSHCVDARSPSGAHIGLLAVVILAGVVHAATSLFVVSTDYEARPGFVRFLTPALAVGAGALVVSTGRTVVSTEGQAPTPGHLAGSACESCHAGTEGRHGQVSVADHRDSMIGCEDCHDVVRGRRPWLARSWPAAESPCTQCHEDAWGGFEIAAPTPTAPASGGGMPSASVAALVAPPPPALCAVRLVDASQLEDALAKLAAVSYPLHSSDQRRFAAGETRIALRVATHRSRLFLDAAWTDATEDGGDRLDVLTPADASAPGFEKLGCVDTCHLGDAKPHRAEAGEPLALFVVDGVRAREHRLTDSGIVSAERANAELEGSLTRTTDGWRVRMSFAIPPARFVSRELPIGISVFDGLPKAHALRAAPVRVRFDCP